MQKSKTRNILIAVLISIICLIGGVILIPKNVALQTEVNDHNFRVEGEIPKDVDLYVSDLGNNNYDITLKDSNGTEWQPVDYGKTLTVSIDNISGPSYIKHISDEGEQNVEVTHEKNTLTFETNHFSVYAIVSMNYEDSKDKFSDYPGVDGLKYYLDENGDLWFAGVDEDGASEINVNLTSTENPLALEINLSDVKNVRVVADGIPIKVNGADYLFAGMNNLKYVDFANLNFAPASAAHCFDNVPFETFDLRDIGISSLTAGGDTIISSMVNLKELVVGENNVEITLPCEMYTWIYNIPYNAIAVDSGLVGETLHYEKYDKVLYTDGENVYNTSGAFASLDLSENFNRSIMAYIFKDGTMILDGTGDIGFNGVATSEAEYRASQTKRLQPFSYFDNSKCKITRIVGSDEGCTISGRADYLFKGLTNLQTISGNINFDGITSSVSMFEDSGNGTTDLTIINSLNTRNIKNMANMFKNTNISNINLSSWDLSNCTNLSGFVQNSTINAIGDLSSWDVKNVSDFTNFAVGSNLSNFVGRNWDFVSTTTISGIFKGCKNLRTVDISGWNMKTVTDASSVFEGCSSLKNVNTTGSKIHYTENISNMFNGCDVRTLDLSSWIGIKLINVEGFLTGCDAIEELDTIKNSAVEIVLPTTLYDDNGTSYDAIHVNERSVYLTNQVTGSLYTYNGKAYLKEDATDVINIGGNVFFFDDGVVIYDGKGEVDSTKVGEIDQALKDGVTTLIISNNGFKPTANSVEGLFGGYNNLINLVNFNSNAFDLSKVSDCGKMFKGDTSLTSIDFDGITIPDGCSSSDLLCGMTIKTLIMPHGYTESITVPHTLFKYDDNVKYEVEIPVGNDGVKFVDSPSSEVADPDDVDDGTVSGHKGVLISITAEYIGDQTATDLAAGYNLNKANIKVTGKFRVLNSNGVYKVKEYNIPISDCVVTYNKLVLGKNTITIKYSEDNKTVTDNFEVLVQNKAVYHVHHISNGTASSNTIYDTSNPSGCYAGARHTHNQASSSCAHEKGKKLCGHWDCVMNVGNTQRFKCTGCGATAEQHVEISGPGWGMGDHYKEYDYWTCGDSPINTWTVQCGKTEGVTIDGVKKGVVNTEDGDNGNDGYLGSLNDLRATYKGDPIPEGLLVNKEDITVEGVYITKYDISGLDRNTYSNEMTDTDYIKLDNDNWNIKLNYPLKAGNNIITVVYSEDGKTIEKNVVVPGKAKELVKDPNDTDPGNWPIDGDPSNDLPGHFGIIQSMDVVYNGPSEIKEELSLNKDDFKVTVKCRLVYDNNTTEIKEYVLSSDEFTITPDVIKVGENVITVTYSEDGKTLTNSDTVIMGVEKVEKNRYPDGITVVYPYESQHVGSTLETDKIEVYYSETIEYDNGTKDTKVPAKKTDKFTVDRVGGSISILNVIMEGDNKFEVTVNDLLTTFTAELNVYGAKADGIVIVNPSRMPVNSRLKSTDVVVKYTYSAKVDGNIQNGVTLNSDDKITEFSLYDSVLYDESDVTKSLSQLRSYDFNDVLVADDEAISISLGNNFIKVVDNETGFSYSTRGCVVGYPPEPNRNNGEDGDGSNGDKDDKTEETVDTLPKVTPTPKPTITPTPTPTSKTKDGGKESGKTNDKNSRNNGNSDDWFGTFNGSNLNNNGNNGDGSGTNDKDTSVYDEYNETTDEVMSEKNFAQKAILKIKELLRTMLNIFKNHPSFLIFIILLLIIIVSYVTYKKVKRHNIKKNIEKSE